jgi:hypothetical protein
MEDVKAIIHYPPIAPENVAEYQKEQPFIRRGIVDIVCRAENAYTKTKKRWIPDLDYLDGVYE